MFIGVQFKSLQLLYSELYHFKKQKLNVFTISDSFASRLQKRKVLEESGAAPEGQQQQPPKVIRHFPQTRPVADNAAGRESSKRRLSKDILAGVSILFLVKHTLYICVLIFHASTCSAYDSTSILCPLQVFGGT